MGAIEVYSKETNPANIYVVTGMGMLTPVGRDVAENWQNITAGYCGIDVVQPLELYTAWKSPVLIAAQIQNFKYASYIREGIKEIKRGRPFAVQIGVEVAGMALEDAGLLDITERKDALVYPNDPKSLIHSKKVGGLVGIKPEQLGGMHGSTVGGAATEAVRYSKILQQYILKGEGLGVDFSSFAANDMIPDTLSAAISMTYQARGTYAQIGSACSSGANSIIRAIDTLRAQADDEEGVRVMIASGVESQIDPVTIAAFVQNRALTRDFNDDPKAGSRPFDRRRSGFVFGEGGSAIIIESLQHALEREAPRIYAVIIGYGEGADAGVSLTAPDGIGNRRAMRMSLRRAGISEEDVDYVNAHATSTEFDKMELAAIQDTISRDVAISSTKGQTGHLTGAGGNVEAVYSILALQEGNSAPPGINLEDPEIEANYVTQYDPNKRVNVAFSNSFAFGGHNVSLGFARHESANIRN